MSIEKAEPWVFLVLKGDPSYWDKYSCLWELLFPRKRQKQCFFNKERQLNGSDKVTEDGEALLLRTGMQVVHGGTLFSGVELEMVLIRTQCNFLPKCSAISSTDGSFNPSVLLSAFKTPL